MSDSVLETRHAEFESSFEDNLAGSELGVAVFVGKSRDS